MFLIYFQDKPAKQKSLTRLQFGCRKINSLHELMPKTDFFFVIIKPCFLPARFSDLPVYVTTRIFRDGEHRAEWHPAGVLRWSTLLMFLFFYLLVHSLRFLFFTLLCRQIFSLVWSLLQEGLQPRRSCGERGCWKRNQGRHGAPALKKKRRGLCRRLLIFGGLMDLCCYERSIEMSENDV